MRILPFLDPTRKAQATGLSCPDCPGTLVVSGESRHVRFRCRIGHAYSLDDLVEAKEDRIEGHLWAGVTALREIADLLRCAVDEGLADGSRTRYERRAESALRQAQALQHIIDEDRPAPIEDAGEPTAAEEP
jgi:two-component system chemotaxis response regulator CheB